MSGPERPVAETLRAAAVVLRERAAKATPGPWVAMYADPLGWPLDHEPGYLGDGEAGELTLVSGSALPIENGCFPSSYQDHHLLAEHCDDLPREQAQELMGSLRWAATVHPGVAEPLAAMLEFEAGIADGAPEVYEDVMPAPVAVARVILGETPGESR